MLVNVVLPVPGTDVALADVVDGAPVPPGHGTVDVFPEPFRADVLAPAEPVVPPTPRGPEEDDGIGQEDDPGGLGGSARWVGDSGCVTM